jgi:hypothetical protein
MDPRRPGLAHPLFTRAGRSVRRPLAVEPLRPDGAWSRLRFSDWLDCYPTYASHAPRQAFSGHLLSTARSPPAAALPGPTVRGPGSARPAGSRCRDPHSRTVSPYGIRRFGLDTSPQTPLFAADSLRVLELRKGESGAHLSSIRGRSLARPRSSRVGLAFDLDRRSAKGVVSPSTQPGQGRGGLDAFSGLVSPAV